jgi:hypothetical protein
MAEPPVVSQFECNGALIDEQAERNAPRLADRLVG